MKDATGELSMTAVAVVAIAGLAAVFTLFIFPQLKTQITASTYCSQAFDCTPKDKGNTTGEGTHTCKYCKDTACDSTGTVNCNLQKGVSEAKTE